MRRRSRRGVTSVRIGEGDGGMGKSAIALPFDGDYGARGTGVTDAVSERVSNDEGDRTGSGMERDEITQIEWRRKRRLNGAYRHTHSYLSSGYISIWQHGRQTDQAGTAGTHAIESNRQGIERMW